MNSLSAFDSKRLRPHRPDAFNLSPSRSLPFHMWGRSGGNNHSHLPSTIPWIEAWQIGRLRKKDEKEGGYPSIHPLVRIFRGSDEWM